MVALDEFPTSALEGVDGRTIMSAGRSSACTVPGAKIAVAERAAMAGTTARWNTSIDAAPHLVDYSPAVAAV